MRGMVRLASALVMLSYVVCHLLNHALALVSLRLANQGQKILLAPWQSDAGTWILGTAVVAHLSNALWSVYVRRAFRLARWEAWQLGLGLTLPILLMNHVMSTRVAHELAHVTPDYYSVLVVLWAVAPAKGVLQAIALSLLWTHAGIGVHYWLRTKSWYDRWRWAFAVSGLLLPTLALAGYVAAGSQLARRAAEDGEFVATILEDAEVTAETTAAATGWTMEGWSGWLALVMLPFAARLARHWLLHVRRPALLGHIGGKTMPMLPGATVLETLRDNGVPHASVCGGRARCTTCRVRVIRGVEALPPPGFTESRALARIKAPPGVRLACQLRPTADLAVVPLLPAKGTLEPGRLLGGLEGEERPVTVMFIDLRGSTRLGEAHLPYDVMFILDLFFTEMAEALEASRGHYAAFTGDGLMALYGLDGDPKAGVAAALHGARDMLARLDLVNRQLAAQLKSPLRIGIGIHFGEAIVGPMGPPQVKVTSAVGDVVNTAARLESMTKEHDCLLALSRAAAVAAGLALPEAALRRAAPRGKSQPVEFYVLDAVPVAEGAAM